MKKIKVNIQDVANQAVGYLRGCPCAICCCESFCGIKYKGTCKIARRIRLMLKIYDVAFLDGETETQKIPVKEALNG